MATRYFVNGGINNNFSSTTNWSTSSGGATGSSVPTLNDDAIFDGNSGNCTVDVNSAVGNLFFTGTTDYTSTITMNANITVGRNSAFSGDVTLAGGFTDANVTGTGKLIINQAGSSPDLTSNGGIWNAGLEVDGAITITLAGNWTVNNFTKNVTGTTTLNGNTLNVRGDITIAQILSGTTVLVANGTGLQTYTTISAGRLNLDFNINKTSGTFSLTGDLTYGTTTARTLTYTAGTVSFGSGARLVAYSSTMNTGSLIWPWFYIAANTQTYTFTNNFYVGNTFSIGGSSTINAGGTVSIYGNIEQFAGCANSGGGTKIVIAGTGSQVWTSSGNTFTNSIDINKPSGTFSWNGSVAFGNATFSYISGGCDLTNTRFNFTSVSPATAWDLKGLTVGTFSGNSGGVQTLVSTCSVVDLLCGASTHNGATMSILRDITMAGNVAGTAPLNFIGTGTFTGAGTGFSIQNAIICDTDGTLFLSGTITANTRSFTYIKGNFNPLPGSIFRVSAGYTFVSNGNVFNEVQLAGATVTHTFTGDFRCKTLVLAATTNHTISNANLYCESIYVSGGAISTYTGTTFIFYGDGYYQNDQVLRGLTNVIIDCSRLKLIGQVAFVGGTIRYVKGEVITDGSIVHFNGANSTLIDCHKIPFDRIKFRTRTLTFNQFFCGTPQRKVKFLTDQATAQTLTINFQDDFPKFARFVDFNDNNLLAGSSITTTRPGQLTLLTDGKKSFSRVTGVKYINTLGNGTLTEKAVSDVYVPTEATTFIGDPATEKF